MKTNGKNEKKRILAVDDEAANTRIVRIYLEQHDVYIVREENDPKAALTAALEFQPHLILLDVMMPRMDGGQLAASFEANLQLRAVPIVFLTSAVTQREVTERGGRVGGYSFVAKPFVLSELAACVKKHLGE